MNPPKQNLWWRALFGACCALLVLPLWTTAFLPMVDLPQHAALISVLHRLGDPQYGYAESFSLNLLTPYLLGYGLTWLLSLAVSVPTALRILISAAVLAVPLALRAFNSRIGGRPEWCFLGFPIALSFSFAWGFLNYLIGIPLAIWFLAWSFRFAAAPTWRSGIRLAVMSLALFWCHLIVAAFSCLIAATVTALRSPSPRQALVRCAPFLTPAPLAMLWLLRTQTTEAQVSVGTVLGWDVQRVPLLPVHLLGSAAVSLGEARGVVYLIGGLCLLALPFLTGAIPDSRPWRLAPLLVCLGFYFLTPKFVFGTGQLFPRFAVFVIPFFILALKPKDFRATASNVLRYLPPLFAIVWLTYNCLAFHAFDRETVDFRYLLDQAEDRKRVLSMVFDRNSEVFAGPQYLHFPAWYQVEHGGYVDFSFAMFFPEMVRYRDSSTTSIPLGFEWMPGSFDWDRHGGDNYDLFIVRAQFDLSPMLFADRRVRLRYWSGRWWLYERVEP